MDKWTTWITLAWSFSFFTRTDMIISNILIYLLTPWKKRLNRKTLSHKYFIIFVQQTFLLCFFLTSTVVNVFLGHYRIPALSYYWPNPSQTMKNHFEVFRFHLIFHELFAIIYLTKLLTTSWTLINIKPSWRGHQC